MARSERLGEITVPPSPALYFLQGGGAAAQRIAEIDWAATSLGAIESWGPGLRTAVGMMLASRFPKAIVWGPDRMTMHNDAFRPILGDKPDAQGRPFDVVWQEAWSEIGPILERAFAGEAVFVEDFPLTIDRFGYPEQGHFTFCYSPIRDETGTVAGIMDTVIETTARVESQRRLEVLNSELAHRIRNTLTMVSAIARQTLMTQSDAATASEVLAARLRALAGTHGLLTEGSAVEADVDSLLGATLASHLDDLGRISRKGPRTLLPERQALGLALAVNELATNALKYGALSRPEGRVDISWTIHQDLRFDLIWTERDGPAVLAPRTRSFGTTLLQHIVPADFRGTAQLTYDAAGLIYSLAGRIERPRPSADPADPSAAPHLVQ